MQLKLSKTHYSLRLILLLLFLLVLIGEAYLVYNSLYANLFAPQVPPSDGNVVRVNLKAYEDTVKHLESLYDYQPEPLALPRSNPFN